MDENINTVGTEEVLLTEQELKMQENAEIAAENAASHALPENLKAKHLTINEISIINALRAGKSDTQEISDIIRMPMKITRLVLGSLVRKQVISIDGTKVTLIRPDRKTLRLGGNLLLPVSKFVDKDSQVWMIRGTWHKVPEHVDVTDIEWFDDTVKETSLHEKIEKRKRSDAAPKRRSNFIEVDGKASDEDLAMKGHWHAIDDDFKMYVLSVSAKRASIELSPRYKNDQIEYPWGSNPLPTLVSIETVRAMYKQELKFMESDARELFTMDLYLDRVPNTLPAAIDGPDITYLSIKIHSETEYAVTTNVLTRNGTRNKNRTVSEEPTIILKSEYKSWVLEAAPLFANAVNNITK